MNLKCFPISFVRYHALDAGFLAGLELGLETQVKSSEVKSRKIFFHLRLERLQNSSGVGGGVAAAGVGGGVPSRAKIVI